ncbi:MAG: proton-conducting transporter membrane subunit [Anaerolineae bacterium]|nr:proton-conducting transporter membrane subunit [Anaerolineae bacterium]
MLGLLCAGVSLLAVIPVYLLRRWRGVALLLAAIVSAVLGLGVLLLPLDQTFVVGTSEFTLGGSATFFGRSIILGPLAQTGMLFLFLSSAAFFLLAWPLGAGELYAPVGLGGLGLLSAALVFRPLVYAALILELAAVLFVLLLRGGVGGARYLTFFVLAVPGPLVAHWLLDMYALTPDQTEWLTTASVLIGLSFALMLGLVPFHPWLPALARSESPLAVALIFTAVGGTVWFLLLDYLATYPWLSQSPHWSSALTVLGVGTAVAGGLLGTTRRGWGTLLGYAVMVDTGMLILALGKGGATGLELERAMMLTRTWGVLTMAAGLAAMGVNGASEQKRSPWGVVAAAVGLLSLAGFPPTVGFASRWGLYRLLFLERPMTVLALLLASVGPVVGMLRMLPPSLRPEAFHPRASVVVDLLLALATAGAIGMGMFPQMLMDR